MERGDRQENRTKHGSGQPAAAHAGAAGDDHHNARDPEARLVRPVRHQLPRTAREDGPGSRTGTDPSRVDSGRVPDDVGGGDGPMAAGHSSVHQHLAPGDGNAPLPLAGTSTGRSPATAATPGTGGGRGRRASGPPGGSVLHGKVGGLGIKDHLHLPGPSGGSEARGPYDPVFEHGGYPGTLCYGDRAPEPDAGDRAPEPDATRGAQPARGDTGAGRPGPMGTDGPAEPPAGAVRLRGRKSPPPTDEPYQFTRSDDPVTGQGRTYVWDGECCAWLGNTPASQHVDAWFARRPYGRRPVRTRKPSGRSGQERPRSPARQRDDRGRNVQTVKRRERRRRASARAAAVGVPTPPADAFTAWRSPVNKRSHDGRSSRESDRAIGNRSPGSGRSHHSDVDDFCDVDRDLSAGERAVRNYESKRRRAEALWYGPAALVPEPDHPGCSAEMAAAWGVPTLAPEQRRVIRETSASCPVPAGLRARRGSDGDGRSGSDSGTDRDDPDGDGSDDTPPPPAPGSAEPHPGSSSDDTIGPGTVSGESERPADPGLFIPRFAGFPVPGAGRAPRPTSFLIDWDAESSLGPDISWGGDYEEGRDRDFDDELGPGDAGLDPLPGPAGPAPGPGGRPTGGASPPGPVPDAGGCPAQDTPHIVGREGD